MLPADQLLNFQSVCEASYHSFISAVTQQFSKEAKAPFSFQVSDEVSRDGRSAVVFLCCRSLKNSAGFMHSKDSGSQTQW